jgi:transcriptional regulator with XRE-family HTH domain
MPQRRTEKAFRDDLPRLLAERGLSQRRLAQLVGLNQSYVTLVLKGRRAPSMRLLRGATDALELPMDYFREYREAVVIEHVKADAAMLERVYQLITRSSR